MENIPVKLNNLDTEIVKANALREDLAESASEHGVKSGEYGRTYDRMIGLLQTNIDEVLDVWIKHLKKRRDALRRTT